MGLAVVPQQVLHFEGLVQRRFLRFRATPEFVVEDFADAVILVLRQARFFEFGNVLTCSRGHL